MTTLPVKICGITRMEDALLAVELGAAAVGFVFYPKSSRCMDAETAHRIGQQLPAGVARVGVFVNPDPETLHFTAEVAGLTHIQLHGDESPYLCRHSPLPVIKNMRAAAVASAGELRNFPAAAFLVDGSKPGELGSVSGRNDWEFCAKLRESKFTVLAGGLSADNIAAAVRLAQPDAIDLSSSVESRSGIKDPAKLRHFFAAVRRLEYPDSRLPKGFLSLT